MDAISPDIIWKSFKKCGISNAIDGSEDNLFQNDDDDDTYPFEGFDEQDFQMDEDILANISSYNEAAIEVSEDEGEIDSDLEETKESDYDSPGH